MHFAVYDQSVKLKQIDYYAILRTSFKIYSRLELLVHEQLPKPGVWLDKINENSGNLERFYVIISKPCNLLENQSQ